MGETKSTSPSSIQRACIATSDPADRYPGGGKIHGSIVYEQYVLSGKGLAPAANPRGPAPVSPTEGTQYIASLLGGAWFFAREESRAIDNL